VTRVAIRLATVCLLACDAPPDGAAEVDTPAVDLPAVEVILEGRLIGCDSIDRGHLRRTIAWQRGHLSTTPCWMRLSDYVVVKGELADADRLASRYEDRKMQALPGIARAVLLNGPALAVKKSLATRGPQFGIWKLRRLEDGVLVAANLEDAPPWAGPLIRGEQKLLAEARRELASGDADRQYQALKALMDGTSREAQDRLRRAGNGQAPAEPVVMSVLSDATQLVPLVLPLTDSTSVHEDFARTGPVDVRLADLAKRTLGRILGPVSERGGPDRNASGSEWRTWWAVLLETEAFPATESVKRAVRPIARITGGADMVYHPSGRVAYAIFAEKERDWLWMIAERGGEQTVTGVEAGGHDLRVSLGRTQGVVAWRPNNAATIRLQPLSSAGRPAGDAIDVDVGQYAPRSAVAVDGDGWLLGLQYAKPTTPAKTPVGAAGAKSRHVVELWPVGRKGKLRGDIVKVSDLSDVDSGSGMKQADLVALEEVASGHALVVWRRWMDSSGSGLKASDGLFLSLLDGKRRVQRKVQINDDSEGGHSFRGHVAPRQESFCVAWSTYDNRETRLYARTFAADGTPTSPAVRMARHVETKALRPAVDARGCTVAWATSEDGRFRAHARRLGWDATVEPTRRIYESPGRLTVAALSSVGGTLRVAMVEERLGKTQLLEQQVDW